MNVDCTRTYILIVIMVTLRSVLVAILASTPSFTHAFTSHNTQQQQHVVINIIEGEPTSRHHQALSSSSSPEDGTSSSATSPPSRRSFLFSAAAVMAGGSSWQCRPLLAEAAPTDCFQDCLKNCKLIAPKVSSHLGKCFTLVFIESFFLISHYLVEFFHTLRYLTNIYTCRTRNIVK